MKRTEKHMIWKSWIDTEDLPAWIESIKDCRPDCADASADDLERIALRENAYYLEDERLAISRISYPAGIIAIADVGLRNGRRAGYKIIASGSAADCLHYTTDDAEFYVSARGDLESVQYHHDDRNYVMYRAIRPECSEKQIDNFIDKILAGRATRRDVCRYTAAIGPDIAAVYGFKL